MGIEPTSEAWEASILPLYDARSFSSFLIIHNQVTERIEPRIPAQVIPRSPQCACSFIRWCLRTAMLGGRECPKVDRLGPRNRLLFQCRIDGVHG